MNRESSKHTLWVDGIRGFAPGSVTVTPSGLPVEPMNRLLNQLALYRFGDSLGTVTDAEFSQYVPNLPFHGRCADI